MSLILFAYELERAYVDYSELAADLEEVFPKWKRCTESVWIVITDYTVEEVKKTLLQYFGKDDRILVAELTGEGAWSGFGEVGANWLKFYFDEQKSSNCVTLCL